MNIFYVYEHTRPDTGGVFYVGKGHASRAFSKAKRSKYWNNLVTKAGGFSVSILVEDLDEELAFLVEMERIAQLRKLGVRLCNLTSGGEGPTGHKHTDETKAKIAKASSAKWTGVPRSEDQKAKISAALKGRPLNYVRSEETRRKLSESNKGKVVTAETKAKISKSLVGIGKGIPKSEEHKAKISAGRKRYFQGMAVIGDRHSNDAKRLQDSWPKVKD